MPLPPSTSGRTSLPEMMTGLRAFIASVPTSLSSMIRLPAYIGRIGPSNHPQRCLEAGQYPVRRICDDALHTNFAELPRPGPVIDRVGCQTIALAPYLGRPFRRQVVLTAVNRDAALFPGIPLPGGNPILVQQEAARQLGRLGLGRGQARRLEAGDQRRWPGGGPEPQDLSEGTLRILGFAAGAGFDLDVRPEPFGQHQPQRLFHRRHTDAHEAEAEPS